VSKPINQGPLCSITSDEGDYGRLVPRPDSPDKIPYGIPPWLGNLWYSFNTKGMR